MRVLFSLAGLVIVVVIIMMLAVFFFVIHIPMVFHFYNKDNLMFWVALIRIPLQLVLINWALKFAQPGKKKNNAKTV